MKILMVEDHELFAKNAIAAFLAEHDVTVVPSISRAKQKLRAEAFDVLLVDFDLEDGKGDELVRWVRAEGRSATIIAVSSHEDGNAMLEAAGANTVCSKMEFSKISEVIGGHAASAGEDTMLEFIAFTEGHRTVNEDRAEVLDLGDRLVAVVVDGAGGTGGGRAAAENVVERVRASAAHLRTESTVAALLRVLDFELLRSSEAGECAVVVVIIEGGRISGASVGDCEAWMFRDREPDVLTHGQSRKPLLGTGDAVVTPFTASLAGTVLLATDGLTKYVPRHQVVEAVRANNPMDEIASTLVDGARLPTGALQDDVGLVLVRRTLVGPLPRGADD